MSTVAEFIAVRENIETLVRQIALFVEKHAAQDSRQRLNEANQQLEKLKTMVANDVQVIAVGRLTRQLVDLGAKVAKMPVGSASAKKKSQQVS